MIAHHVKRLFVPETLPIQNAMEVMVGSARSGGPSGIVIVVDSEGLLRGVVTDGDVRRGLLDGVELHDPVSSIMTRDPIVVRDRQVNEGTFTDLIKMVRRSHRMRDVTAGKVVVVDESDRVVDLISLSDIMSRRDVRSQNVCVVGMGYVGVTLATALADVGFTIYGAERRNHVRQLLQVGDLHLHEAGLPRIFTSLLDKNLFICADPREADAEVFVLCVATPINAHRAPVLDDLETASADVGKVLKRGDLLIVRSTVPIGTTREIVLPILEQASELRAGSDFDLIYAPERTVAGNALEELRTLPQVIGALNRNGLERGTTLFRELTPIVIAMESLEEAEAVKLINNAFRDHVFAFANETAALCSRWNLNVYSIIQSANEGYPRDRIPMPSPGVGGACLYKDPYLLLDSAQKRNYEPVLLGKSRIVNEAVPYNLAKHIGEFIQAKGLDWAEAGILVVGFAFKGNPETSDMRNSSTLDLVHAITAFGGQVRGYDPIIDKDDLDEIVGVTAVDLEEGFEDADCVVIMNNHPSYSAWDVHGFVGKMRTPALFFDGWRMFLPTDVHRVDGIVYSSLADTRIEFLERAGT